jgi:hypothetical protein
MGLLRAIEGNMRTDIRKTVVHKIRILNILDKTNEYGTKRNSTDVSEEYVASIFRVEEAKHCLPPAFTLVSWLVYSSTLKMKATENGLVSPRGNNRWQQKNKR